MKEDIEAKIERVNSGEKKAAKVKRKCNGCVRFHYGVCWGPNMERIPLC